MNENKTIIVVGATGGIGSVISRKFVEFGANVALSARTESKLTSLSESLGREKILVTPADASSPEDVQGIFNKAKQRFGGVDAVIIAAGTWNRLSIDGEIQEAVSLAKRHFDALFLPSFVVGYIAQKFFRDQGNGLIVNISSHAALRPELQGNLTYGPMKSASHHYMLALRKELEGTNVRVTDIAPAIVNTPDASGLLNTEEKSSKAVQPEEIAGWIIEHIQDEKIPDTKLFDSSIVL
jgi:3-hydroxy acid dehydrogenase / malonic semialdehyde reductase